MANYNNDKESIITAKEWQLVNHIILLLELFLEQRSVVKRVHCSQAWCYMQDHWRNLLTLIKVKKNYKCFWPNL